MLCSFKIAGRSHFIRDREKGRDKKWLSGNLIWGHMSFWVPIQIKQTHLLESARNNKYNTDLILA